MPSTPPFAAIDLGSNSFHLLVAQRDDLKPLARHKEMVQLARQQGGAGQLHPQAQQRAIDCLQRFRDIMVQFPGCQAYAVGTEALRRMPDPADVIDRWHKILNCPIHIITAEEEARLTFIGLSCDPSANQSTPSFASIDIGGASTELCCGHQNVLQHWISLDLGCITLAQRFFDTNTSQRLQQAAFNHAIDYCEQQLSNIDQSFRRAAQHLCLGAAGTMKVIATLISGDADRDFILQTELKALMAGSIAKGALPEGLDNDLRWDVLPAGMALLMALMNTLHIERLQLSPFGIKEGIIRLHAHHS